MQELSWVSETHLRHELPTVEQPVYGYLRVKEFQETSETQKGPVYIPVLAQADRIRRTTGDLFHLEVEIER